MVFSEKNQVSGTARDGLAAVAQQSASVFVDALPRSLDIPLSDEALDPIAAFMNGVPAPLFEHRFARGRTPKPLIEVLDKSRGGYIDPSEVADRSFRDRRR